MTGELQYLSYLKLLLQEGVKKGDRTGTGMREIFGSPQLEIDQNTGEFPLLTTKKMFLKGVIVELLWFLRGDTNIKYLQEHGVHIWDEWANENGDLGPVYGSQWRKWEGKNGEVFDQIQILIDEIRTKPDSRRMMVSAWNPAEVDQMKLPPCHSMFQCNVQRMSLERRMRWAEVMGWTAPPILYSDKDSQVQHCTLLMDAFGAPTHELHLKLYQRSADWFLGVPFNIASYALLQRMLAQVCGLAPGRFIHTFGSAHLYENHIEQAEEQLSRLPFGPPRMVLNPEVKSIDGFKLEDFALQDYQCHPAIKAPIAV